MATPYDLQPVSAFWSKAVGPDDLAGIWTPKFAIDRAGDAFVSAGSCFSNHIGRFLLDSGFRFLIDDGAGRRPGSLASFDLGNVYTARQLVYWLEAAAAGGAAGGGAAGGGAAGGGAAGGGMANGATGGKPAPPEAGIHRDPATGTVTDLLRLGIGKPEFPDVPALLAARRRACAEIRALLGRATIFCFTLGLTEGWETPDGDPYPVCPAVRVPGVDPAAYRFVNYDHDAVRADLERAVGLLAAANPHLRLILTVSPVPLAATATADHVVPATAYSKAVLRAAAGWAAARFQHVDYFPSYELVTSHIHGHDFFAPDRRNVTDEGVAFVMRHFLAGVNAGAAAPPADDRPAVAHATAGQPTDRPYATSPGAIAEICEEELYDGAIRGPRAAADAAGILLLGTSQIREVSDRLELPHRVFTMNASEFVRMAFEEDPAFYFQPTVEPFRTQWRDFAREFDVRQLTAGRCTVVTDIGCQSYWWDQEIAAVIRHFVDEPLFDPARITPFQVQIAFEHRRAPHLLFLKKLVDHGNRVIWLADPPFIPTNREAPETLMINLVRRAGVRHILRPREFPFDPSRELAAPGAMHGNDYYYETVAAQLRRAIEAPP